MTEQEKKGLPTIPLHTCSHLSEITNCRLFYLCSSADLIWYIYQKLNITLCSLLPTLQCIHKNTHTHTEQPPLLPLEKRSSSTLDLLFKIQALVGEKRQKRGCWGGLIYDQIVRKSLILQMSRDPRMSDLHFPKWRRSSVLMESPRAIYQCSLSRKALLRPTSQTTSTFIVTHREVFTSRKQMY